LVARVETQGWSANVDLLMGIHKALVLNIHRNASDIHGSHLSSHGGTWMNNLHELLKQFQHAQVNENRLFAFHVYDTTLANWMTPADRVLARAIFGKYIRDLQEHKVSCFVLPKVFNRYHVVGSG